MDAASVTIDAIAPGSVEYRLGASYPLAPQAFCPWCEHPMAVLEWIDADGMRTRLRGIDGEAPFARPPGRWHLYLAGTGYSEQYARPDRIREHCWMFFRLLAPLPGVSDRAFAAIDDPEGRLLHYGRTMFAVQQRGEAHAGAQLHGLLWAAIGEVLSAARQGGDGSPARPWVVRATPPPDETLLARVDAVVLPLLARPPSVAELASALHCSVSALSHRLKDESGMTVVERIRWLRVREARRLLASGSSVKEVGVELGFSSATYFARVFRAVSGLSPGEYQDQARAPRA
ncbi:MAG: helix-turn-helix transcriptional regulator [Planctomycetes bacterium]|nr:helix-turn-helix transcriptional regulator [Planctomycetota bacterium]